ncbi:MAG: NAD(P)/FAD-dependent oxidoreductase [bacterium]
MSARQRTRILILGGGFGGLQAALSLEKTLARRPDVEITLVNKQNFFLFTPMLHEVAASDLDPSNIVNPAHKLLRRVHFLCGEVRSVDLSAKRVTVLHGLDGHAHELPYDYLVLSLGSSTNFFDTPGVEERSLTMKSLGDAIHLRNRLISHLEEANSECSAHVREPLLTFVVAGGGFAGVETIAGINDFLREAVRFYPRLREEMLRVVLVHPGAVILPELGEALGGYAQKKLGEREVEIRLNVKVAGASADHVRLSDGTVIRSNCLIWTAGTSPSPLLRPLPCMKERGRVVVNEFLEVAEWPGVFAVGDCAAITDPESGQPYPPTAQHALREGKVVAHNLIAAIDGGRKQPFRYKAIGQLAAIGRRTGVARILGVNISGFIAWWMWRTIYLSKLPRFEKKVRVMLDWTLDLLFSKDIVQFETFRSQEALLSRDETRADHASAPAFAPAPALALAPVGEAVAP